MSSPRRLRRAIAAATVTWSSVSLNAYTFDSLLVTMLDNFWRPASVIVIGFAVVSKYAAVCALGS